MGQLSKGVSYGRLSVYVPGYVLGTRKEAPSAHFYLTSNMTFAGFVSNYTPFTPGVFVITQDATGGRTINWDGKLLFNGSSTLNLGPNQRTIIDVIRMPGGNWLGTVRAGQGTGGGGGPATNGLPAGGTPTQVLRKNSLIDYDAVWYSLLKADVGLGNVDDTADINKPVSDPQQEALDLKAPLLNPEFQGKVKLPGPTGAGSGVNFGLGFPPTTPENGDFWPTTDGFFAHYNNTTVQLGGRISVAIQDFQMAASDMITPLVAATNASYARVSRAGTISGLRASLIQASNGGPVTIDVKVNGVSILSTPLTIDEGEKTSVTALVPPVIIDGTLNSDDELTVDIVDGGTNAMGLIVTCQFEDTINPAAGLTGEVQYMDGGTFGSSNQFKWDKTTNTLTVTNLTVTSGITGVMTNPMTTPGDMVIGGAAGAPARLAGGTANQFLRYVGAAPTWVTMTKAMVGLPNVDDTADNTKEVLSATKWTTARNLEFTGAATGTGLVDGTDDVSIALTLEDSGVTPGIYQQVQVNSKGIVVDGTNPTTLEGYGITNALSNPMLVKGSFIMGGTVTGGFAQPVTLAPGTDGQVLKIVDTAGDMIPTWTTVPEGFDNPMTAVGDLIVGGTAGAATRLAVGADNQIMRVVAGVPTWVAHTALSPTTTEGDLIVRGATVDARLAKGTLGHFLIAGSTTVAWGNAIPSITVTTAANFTGATVTGLTKAMVGLGSVNNTADVAKDVNSATKWTTARTITLTGDVTGSVSIDGSSNVNLATTLNVGDPLQVWTNKSANYTVAANDHSDILNLTGSSAIAVMVPLNATVAIPVGTKVFVYAEGTGAFTIDFEAGVTILGPTGPLTVAESVPQYSFFTLMKKATNTWVLKK